MSGDEKKRFCSECDKFVYDFSRMTPRQVEAIVSIHGGRMCARITRRPDGSLVTLEAPPVHPTVARRASPVINATLAAILGLGVPANALNIDISAAQLIVRSDADGKSERTPFGGGDAVVGGTVVDPNGAVIPNAVVKLISDAGAEIETKTSSEGEFSFAKVPFGAYIMLVEAQRFYTHVNSNVIVDTPYDTRFEVTMKVNQKELVMGGAIGIDMPSSLLDLYRQSDLIAIAQVGRSVVVGTDKEMQITQVRTDLRISSQLKGENDQQVIPFYYWFSDATPFEFKQGARLLAFLQFRKTEDGKRLNGFEIIGWERNSIRELDDGALAVYRQRIEELTAIFRRGDPAPAEIVEWLIRCVEEQATREEGLHRLSDILSLLELQRERENEDKSQSVDVEESAGQSKDDEESSNEQSDDDDRAEMRRENIRLAAALTQEHKTRLANALFAIAELNENDMKLVRLIRELGDERLAPYLVSQLRRVADRAPRLAESLVWTIAQVIKDDDIRRLANDYDDAATYDESEYDDEPDRQDSTRNRRANGLTVEAIKRGAMLKDFLKLVEYKTRQ